MKRIFEYIGLISLVCFSFFVTEKTSLVVKEADTIMIEIKENKDKYKIESVEGIVENNTIIPGVSGVEVNTKKSYRKMKKIGIFDPSLFVYDELKPSVNIKNNLNKYIISGNSSKKMVSLIFLVNDKSIKDLLDITSTVPVNLILNYNWILNNEAELKLLLKSNHNILFSDLNKSNYNELKKIIKDASYCYNPTMDDNYLMTCYDKSLITISPKNSITKQPLLNVKYELEPGKLLVFEINDSLILELPNIINYIESRGYKIANLKEHLSENML